MCKFIKYLIIFSFLFINTITNCDAESKNNKQKLTTIKAVVNHDVITSLDLKNRIKMVASLFEAPINSATKNLFQEQILRSMIDELLQIQEAKKMGIKVNPETLAAAIERIERSRGMSPGELKDRLKSQGIPYKTLEKQVYANLMWVELVQHKLKPFVQITDHETTSHIRQQKKQASKPHYDVQEIFLLTNTQAPTDQALKFAQKLKQQIDSGSDFGALAQQFSDARSAINGGSLSWVVQGELDDKRNQVLATLKEGEVSKPFVANGGVYLLRLNTKKEPQYTTSYIVDYGEMYVPLFFIPNEKVLKEKMDSVHQASKKATSIQKLEEVSKDLGASFEKYTKKNIQNLSEDLQQRLSNLPLKTPSSVYRSQGGLHVFVIDKREKKKMLVGLESPEEAKNSLLNKKLEGAANTYLRQLRRKAHLKNAV